MAPSDPFSPFGGGAFGDQPFGPSPEEGDARGRAAVEGRRSRAQLAGTRSRAAAVEGRRSRAQLSGER